MTEKNLSGSATRGSAPPAASSSPAGATNRRLRGFTLIELLAVTTVLALLVAIAFPGMNNARDSARQACCATGLRTLGTAIMNYTADWKGRYPMAVIASVGAGSIWYETTAPYTGWRVPGGSARELGRLDGGPYRCPSASVTRSPLEYVLRYPANSYVTCDAVLATEWDTGQPKGWDKCAYRFTYRVRKPSVQLALADSDVGVTPGRDRGHVVPSQSAESAWGSLDGAIRARDIRYNHHRRSRANILMADGHVEVGVTARQAHTDKYHNPR